MVKRGLPLYVTRGEGRKSRAEDLFRKLKEIKQNTKKKEKAQGWPQTDSPVAGQQYITSPM